MGDDRDQSSRDVAPRVVQRWYWDRVANEKTFTHPLNVRVLGTHVPLDAAIVDFGCGYGRILNELQELGYRNAQGFDVSTAMLDRGRREYGLRNLAWFDGQRTPLPDRSVDLVVLFAVLTCMPDQRDRTNALVEIRRFLRPGGYLYVSDCPLMGDERHLERYDRFVELGLEYGVFRTPDGAVLRHSSVESFRALMRDFEPVLEKFVETRTMNGSPTIAWQFFGRLSDSAEA